MQVFPHQPECPQQALNPGNFKRHGERLVALECDRRGAPLRVNARLNVQFRQRLSTSGATRRIEVDPPHRPTLDNDDWPGARRPGHLPAPCAGAHAEPKRPANATESVQSASRSCRRQVTAFYSNHPSHQQAMPGSFGRRGTSPGSPRAGRRGRCACPALCGAILRHLRIVEAQAQAPASSASPVAPSPASASHGKASASTACIPRSDHSAPPRSTAPWNSGITWLTTGRLNASAMPATFNHCVISTNTT